MANTKSAEKRNRQSLKRRARNTKVRTGVKNTLKQAREAISSADPKAAAEALRNAARTLQKAATKGVLHPRNAARRIARLSHALAGKTAKKK
jgi:small subunit ribosomal protein S20